VNEIARGRFAPVHYLRHVGIQVPQRQLELAFYQTYGLAEDFSAGKGRRVNVKGYRFAVSRFIPRIAYAVTLLHRHREPPVVDSPELQRLTAELADVAKKNDWNAYRHRPGIGTYTLAGFLYILPKIGPLKLAAVKGPTMDTDREYMRSVLRSADALNFAVRRFTPPPTTRASAAEAASMDVHSQPPPSDPLPAKLGAEQAVPRGSSNPSHPLRNRDLDTGNTVRPGGDPLTDATYCSLVHRLAARPDQLIPPGIKEDILAYYADMSVSFATKAKPANWKNLQADLATLHAMITSNEPLPYPTYGSAEEDPSENAVR
jgi:hypothetical protein